MSFSCLLSLLYICPAQRYPWGRPGSLPKVMASKREMRTPSHPCLAESGSSLPYLPPPSNLTQASTPMAEGQASRRSSLHQDKGTKSRAAPRTVLAEGSGSY